MDISGLMTSYAAIVLLLLLWVTATHKKNIVAAFVRGLFYQEGKYFVVDSTRQCYCLLCSPCLYKTVI
jgi:hypothetical protein